MKILLTGVTGFVGRRLAEELLLENVEINLLVRNSLKLEDKFNKSCNVFQGDTFNIEILEKALEGVDTAIYLIHMMGSDKDYLEAEKRSAENFIKACEKQSVKRVIYLGGLGNKDNLSVHLKSRYITGEILSSSEKVTCIWLRAGVIIGSGSASFEIVRSLVEKLPVMVAPKWVNTLTSPIYIGDVIKYLKAATLSIYYKTIQVDIGMPPMTFKDMVLKTANVMGLKRYIVSVPLLTPRLSSYWLILFSPVNFDIAKELVMGLKHESVLENDNAKKIFPDIKITEFEEAVKLSIDEIEKHQVISRWCDSSKSQVCDVPYVPQVSKAIYADRYSIKIDESKTEKLFQVCKSAGGENGWFALNFLWGIRGLIDKLVGGYGLNRGRRKGDLRIGDSIDFWKVIDIVENKRLLLEAQMKLPGKAWLEFSILDDDFTITAYFYPKGLAGRIYWYLMLPFHKIIFNLMQKDILRLVNELP
ncbi:SDR family oxidoreductase [Deferribacteraceae bacterium V6Fe1]|nr:SDR family oxidoreductase [Deferribacteraceae bacterium V6Fe1]